MMFSLAEAWGLFPAASIPCRSMVKYQKGKRELFLTPEEYRRLGRSDRAGGGRVSGPPGGGAEIADAGPEPTHGGHEPALGRRGPGELRLTDAKTGARMVPLTPTAILFGIARVPGNPWVFSGDRPDSHLSQPSTYWLHVCKRAGTEGVRIHDLRHSFASRALALGESLPLIARLLGHTKIQTTARYAHLARDSIRISAARVAASIGKDIMPRPQGRRSVPRPSLAVGAR